ncbi:unnamed protein product [Amoebophrya sp. A120]|nr:unnamed protein product [Amoebophrya sp. A120]|eukprot:GSA120T00007719001.1
MDVDMGGGDGTPTATTVGIAVAGAAHAAAGQQQPGGSPTSPTARQQQRPKATKAAAEEHQQLSLVRKVQVSFETVRQQAQQKGVDVPRQLKDLGYNRFEDFILSCEQFTWTCDPMALAELGPGMVLYFDFLKYLMSLAAFFFVCYLPAMFAVVKGQDDRELELKSWVIDSLTVPASVNPQGAGAVFTWLINNSPAVVPSYYFAIGNTGKGVLNDNWVIVLYLVSLFFGAISVGPYSVRQERIDQECDLASVYPNDYGLFIRNLPRDECEESKIKEYFEQNALPGDRNNRCEVVKVIIAWDITMFKQYSDKQAQLGKQYFTLLQKGAEKDDPKVLEVKTQFEEVTKELKSLKAGQNLQGSGCAIVVLKHQKDHRAALDKWERSIWLKMVHGLSESFPVCACLEGFVAYMMGTPLYKNSAGEGHLLKVTRAPNPSDVNWQDLGRGNCESLLQRWQLYSVMGVMIGVCFVCTWLLSEWADDEEGNMWVNMTTALTVAALNGILLFASRYLTQFEYHETKTSEDGSTTKKMTVAMVINTAIIQFIVYRDDEHWFRDGGLVTQMMFMVLTHAVIMPWFGMIDIGFKMKQYAANRIDWEKTKLPQEKINGMYTPSELDLPRRYAISLKIFLTALLCLPLFPWAMPFCVLGLMLQYAVDKYMLVTKFARPAFTKNPENAFDALSLLHGTMSLFAPLTFFLFLRPACTDDVKGFLTGLLFPVMFASFATYLLPLPVWRTFTRTFCCVIGGCDKAFYGKDIEDTTHDMDYYTAQMMWGKGMKYHKSHPLYAALPDKVNPENIPRPGSSQAAQQGAQVGAGGQQTVVVPTSTVQMFQQNQQAIEVNLANVLISYDQVNRAGAANAVVIPASDVQVSNNYGGGNANTVQTSGVVVQQSSQHFTVDPYGGGRQQGSYGGGSAYGYGGYGGGNYVMNFGAARMNYQPAPGQIVIPAAPATVDPRQSAGMMVQQPTVVQPNIYGGQQAQQVQTFPPQQVNQNYNQSGRGGRSSSGGGSIVQNVYNFGQSACNNNQQHNYHNNSSSQQTYNSSSYQNQYQNQNQPQYQSNHQAQYQPGGGQYIAAAAPVVVAASQVQYQNPGAGGGYQQPQQYGGPGYGGGGNNQPVIISAADVQVVRQ